MDNTYDYRGNMKRDTSRGRFEAQEVKEQNNTMNTYAPMRNVGEFRQPGFVNNYQPLSGSRASSNHKENGYRLPRRDSRSYDNKYDNPEYPKEPIDALNESRFDRNALNKGEMYQSYVYHDPNYDNQNHQGYNRQPHHDDPKMKYSQATGVTNAETEGYRSRFMNQSQAGLT